MDILKINNETGEVHKHSRYKSKDKGQKERYVYNALLKNGANPYIFRIIHNQLTTRYGKRTVSSTYKIIDRVVKKHSKWITKGYRNITSNGTYLIRYLMIFLKKRNIKKAAFAMRNKERNYSFLIDGKFFNSTQMSTYNQYLISLLH